MENKTKEVLNKDRFNVKIFGITLFSGLEKEVLKIISRRLAEGKKTVIFTPNPEFLVYSRQNPSFKQILNSADINLPDGVGLLWAAKILGQPLRRRLAGADLAAKLLLLAARKHWRVGVVGARRGEKEERERLVRRLNQRYQEAEIANLEETPAWQKQKWELVFACQGMGEQESWIVNNFSRTNALLFIGVGGALDFLAGFAKRAPFWIRKIGFEWFWRLVCEPWRWRRQLNLIKFSWLVLRERIKFINLLSGEKSGRIF